MIAICEPQCIGFEHEAVNSAFVYGVRLAFPDEQIILFADQSHIDAIKRIFILNNIAIDNIEYRPIKVRKVTYFTFSATFISLILFRKLFKELENLGVEHLLLLSISSDGLYAIKMLKLKSISCSIVLHGVFEWITKGPYNPYKTIIHRKVLNFKSAIQWRHSNNYNYIALSPHILNEANKYISTEKYNISAIPHPFIFSKKTNPIQKNEHIKFATIGKGSPTKVKYITNLLNKNNNLKYEIKIIGKSIEGLEGLNNINCVSSNKRLTRNEIEKHIKDVDIILILYNDDEYLLSCSGALFETFAYVKPVLFLSNPCIGYFNSIGNFGYECKDLDELIEKMKYFIINYKQIDHELDIIRNNIINFRDRIDIRNEANKLRNFIDTSILSILKD